MGFLIILIGFSGILWWLLGIKWAIGLILAYVVLFVASCFND